MITSSFKAERAAARPIPPAGAPTRPSNRVGRLVFLSYLLLEKSSKSLIPLSDCPFVLNRLPVFLENLPVSGKCEHLPPIANQSGDRTSASGRRSPTRQGIKSTIPPEPSRYHTAAGGVHASSSRNGMFNAPGRCPNANSSSGRTSRIVTVPARDRSTSSLRDTASKAVTFIEIAADYPLHFSDIPLRDPAQRGQQIDELQLRPGRRPRVFSISRFLDIEH